MPSLIMHVGFAPRGEAYIPEALVHQSGFGAHPHTEEGLTLPFHLQKRCLVGYQGLRYLIGDYTVVTDHRLYAREIEYVLVLHHGVFRYYLRCAQLHRHEAGQKIRLVRVRDGYDNVGPSHVLCLQHMGIDYVPVDHYDVAEFPRQLAAELHVRLYELDIPLLGFQYLCGVGSGNSPAQYYELIGLGRDPHHLIES
ncbi:hypothetical protein AOA81_00245 [Methanomassiliicoccales archaeon RumEn M2]|nr:hypothetical protein AOA81_00245 [Methanomassiliicoccales archaeon RumEn M2]